MKKAYIVIGPPGSGKGTQIDKLMAKRKVNVIQPGVFLREEALKDSSVGKKVKRLISKGNIVPGDLVDRMVMNRLSKIEGDVIFDGYPRTLKQAGKLHQYLKRKKVQIFIVELYLSDKHIIDRINGRRSCHCGETYHVQFNPTKKIGICDKCGKKLYIRSDSKLSVIRKRIRIYYEQTVPVLQYFKQHNEKNIKFIFIDGDQSIKAVYKIISKKIK